MRLMHKSSRTKSSLSPPSSSSSSGPALSLPSRKRRGGGPARYAAVGSAASGGLDDGEGDCSRRMPLIAAIGDAGPDNTASKAAAFPPQPLPPSHGLLPHPHGGGGGGGGGGGAPRRTRSRTNAAANANGTLPSSSQSPSSSTSPHRGHNVTYNAPRVTVVDGGGAGGSRSSVVDCGGDQHEVELGSERSLRRQHQPQGEEMREEVTAWKQQSRNEDGATAASAWAWAWSWASEFPAPSSDDGRRWDRTFPETAASSSSAPAPAARPLPPPPLESASNRNPAVQGRLDHRGVWRDDGASPSPRCSDATGTAGGGGGCGGGVSGWGGNVGGGGRGGKKVAGRVIGASILVPSTTGGGRSAGTTIATETGTGKAGVGGSGSVAAAFALASASASAGCVSPFSGGGTWGTATSGGGGQDDDEDEDDEDEDDEDEDDDGDGDGDDGAQERPAAVVSVPLRTGPLRIDRREQGGDRDRDAGLGLGAWAVTGTETDGRPSSAPWRGVGAAATAAATAAGAEVRGNMVGAEAGTGAIRRSPSSASAGTRSIAAQSTAALVCGVDARGRRQQGRGDDDGGTTAAAVAAFDVTNALSFLSSGEGDVVGDGWLPWGARKLVTSNLDLNVSSGGGGGGADARKEKLRWKETKRTGDLVSPPIPEAAVGGGDSVGVVGVNVPRRKRPYSFVPTRSSNVSHSSAASGATTSEFDDEVDWTPQDSSFGAACPVCGCIPKHIRRVIEFSLIALLVLALVFFVVTTSMRLEQAGGSGTSSRSGGSGGGYDRHYNLDDLFDDDFYGADRDDDDDDYYDDDRVASNYGYRWAGYDGSGSDSGNVFGEEGGGGGRV